MYTKCAETTASIKARFNAEKEKVRIRISRREATKKKKSRVLRDQYEKLPIPSPEGYQALRWGNSIEEVKKQFTSAELNDDAFQLATQNRQVAGQSADIGFAFYENKLAKVVVLFKAIYNNKNKYIDSYEHLGNLLSKKYGPTKRTVVAWSSRKDVFGKRREDWGTALYLGYVTFYAKWTTQHSIVELTLGASENKIYLRIAYSSKALWFKLKDSADRRKLQEL